VLVVHQHQGAYDPSAVTVSVMPPVVVVLGFQKKDLQQLDKPTIEQFPTVRSKIIGIYEQ
jgi:hypothetical protein